MAAMGKVMMGSAKERVMTTDADKSAARSELLKCVRQNPVFAGLSKAAASDVLDAARVRTVAAQDAIIRQGDEACAFGILLSGRAKMVQVTPDGRQVLIRYIVTGQEYGLIAALRGYTYPLTIEAVETCAVLCWPGARLAEFFARYPQVSLNALHIMVIRNQELQLRYRELLTDRVEQRLARALLRLSTIAGEHTAGGTLITLSLTREDLAELIGATLFTVSRTLSQWEQAGYVDGGRERIRICRPDALEQLAGDLDSFSPTCLSPCALVDLMISRRHAPAVPA